MELAPSVVGRDESSDAHVVSACPVGDPGSFAEVVRRHYPFLLAAARKRLGNSHDAEDAVQETFLRAYRGLGGFGREGDWRIGAWLNKILSNVCADVLVRRSAISRSECGLDDASTVDGGEPSATADPVALAAVAEAIESLPRSQGRAFLLRIVDDMSYPALAAELGITEDNARARVHRARTALRAVLSTSSRVTGTFAVVPLLVKDAAGSLLRRSVGLGGRAGSAASPAAAATPSTASSSPLNAGAQIMAQLNTSPVGQIAVMVSSAGSQKGSLVLGIVASLATAGAALSSPVVASLASAPSAAPVRTAQVAPASVLTAAIATSAPAAASAALVAPVAAAPAVTPAGTASGSTVPDPTSAPPAWVSVAASASSPYRSASSTAAVTPTSSCSSAPGSSAPGSSATDPTLPPTGSEKIVSMLSASATGLSSPTDPAFTTTAQVVFSVKHKVPVTVAVGACLSGTGSLLSANLTGQQGTQVQLSGTSVYQGEAPAGTGASGDVAEYLFRGTVQQVSGEPVPGTLPWHVPGAFVAQLEVGASGSAQLAVAFVQPPAGATAPPATAADISGTAGDAGSSAGATLSASSPSPTTTSSSSTGGGGGADPRTPSTPVSSSPPSKTTSQDTSAATSSPPATKPTSAPATAG